MTDPAVPKLLTAPRPTNEAARLAALQRYKMLDTPPEAAFARLTRLAARLFQVPIALIALVDESRVWFKSGVGFDAPEVPRDHTLCRFAVSTDAPLIVPDARLDERFAGNPFVQGEPGVRFYAGAPLLSHDGFNLGTLCLLDRQPREALSAEQQATLIDLAAMVVDELELRLAAQHVAQSEAKDRPLFDSIDEGFCLCELLFDENGEPHDYRFLEVNAAFEQLTGLEEATGKRMRALAPKHEASWFETYGKVVQTREPVRFENYASDLKRWFSVNAFCIGEPQHKQFAVLLTNITAAKQLEADRQQAAVTVQQLSAALERQVRKFDATLSTLTELIFSFDREGRFLYANQVLLDLWGVTAAAVIGKTMADLHYPPTVEQQVLGDLRRVFETGESVRNETPYTNPAGAAGYFEYILSPVLAVDGTVEAVVGSSRDTSERKRMELALRENEERFRTLADHMAQFAWMADAAGWIFWYNQRWFDYTGTTLESMQGWGWQQVHHPDHVDRVVEHFRCCLATGEPWEDTFPLRSRDGTYRWFLSRAIPIRDEQGQILRWFGTNTDITDLKQAEANLQASEELKRRILESSQDCIKVLTLEGQLLYLNAGGLQLLEVDDPASVLNAQWLDFWQDEDRHSAAAALAVAKAGKVGQLQGCCPTAKGNLKCWDVIVTPIRDAAGRVTQLLAISRDVTKQKQAAAEREQLLQREQAARAEAERANQIKDEFLAVLSHELRSPLNPILGWTRLLQTGSFDAARQAEALATIERNAKLQLQLIEDLLDIARIMQGKLTLKPTATSLTFVISAALETVRLAAAAKEITLTLDLEPQVAPIWGDAGRLQQVVWNLLTNAVKFTPKGGQVRVELRQVEQWVQLRVRDTGKGIKAPFIPYVFEYFRQEDGSTTRQFGGLGLGLAIVRQIVTLHGGTVAAESGGEQQGATFMVQLPALEQATPLSSESTGAPLDSEALLDHVQILLVDDDADTREFQAFLLEQYGARVTAVASGLAALQALEQLLPDVIVSDIGMPDMDGYRLMQQIRSRPPSQGGLVPALALTAYAAELDQKRALQAGFQQHLTKPLEPEQFVRAIVSLLQRN